MSETLGKRHPTIRRLRALRRDRALRREEGVFLAEGLHLAREALACGAPIEMALVAPALERREGGARVLDELRACGCAVASVADELIDSLQDARTAQPVLLVVRREERSLESLLDAATVPPLVVVAHGLQDPGNLGSLMRTACAAGATAFLVTGEGADLYHPRAVRATAGAILRLGAQEVAAASLLAALRERDIPALGTDPCRGAPYDRIALTGPCAIFLGGEAAGLPREVSSALVATLTVPMAAGSESLSVAAAGAVLLFEAARQRRGTARDRSAG